MVPNLLKKNSYVLLCTGAAFTLLMAACSKAPAPAPASPPAAVAPPAKPVQKQTSSASRLPAAAENQFDFSNKKDPFKPFVAIAPEHKVSPGASKKGERDSLPIHSYELSQFKVIGIIIGGRDNKAMVTDPGGKSYVLTSGMSIGRNEGRISAIDMSGIEVIEQYRDDNGRVRKEKTKLALPRKQ